MTETVLQQGIDLMVYGMSSVFLFLVMPEMGHVSTESPLSQAVPSKTINPKLLAVIQNAIDQHRGSQ